MIMVNILDNFLMDKDMGEVSVNGTMATDTKDSGKTESGQEKAFSTIIMEEHIKGNGTMIFLLEWALSNTKMEEYMRGTG